MKDAQIVCRELGCLFTYSAPINASFGPGSGPVLQRNVQFKGPKSSIRRCRHRGLRNHPCGHQTVFP